MGRTTTRDKRYTVMLVDDHPIVRHGLSLLINQEADLELCAEANTAVETLEYLKSVMPDIILVDISLQGSSGIELTRAIRESYPDLPVLILSMHDETLYAERALRAGARGYVMKQESAETVLHAVRRVLAGEIYLSDKLASRLLRDVMNGQRNEPDRFGLDMLSDRELEIFEFIGRGLSTRKIAARLSLSVKTVETHRAHIKQKLNLANSAELVHRAFHWVEASGKK